MYLSLLLLLLTLTIKLQFCVLIELLPLSAVPSGSLVVAVSVLPDVLITAKPRLCVKALTPDTKTRNRKTWRISFGWNIEKGFLCWPVSRGLFDRGGMNWRKSDLKSQEILVSITDRRNLSHSFPCIQGAEILFPAFKVLQMGKLRVGLWVFMTSTS